MFKTKERTIDELVSAIVHRESEVDSYQINIDNYTSMLEGMSDLPDWPAEVAFLQNCTSEQIAAADLTDEQFDLVNQLSFRDRVRFLIKTEKLEQAKSKKVLDSLLLKKATVDDDDWAAAVTRSEATPISILTSSQTSEIQSEISKPEYAGLSNAEIANALNAKTQPGMVPIMDIESAAPLEMAAIAQSATRSQQTDEPTDKQLAALAVQRWFDKGEMVDFELPQAQALVGALISYGFASQDKADEIVALKENRASIAEVNDWPVITEEMIALARG